MRKNRLYWIAILGGLASLLIEAQQPPFPLANAGEPLPGLSAADRARFDEGREDFLEVETKEDGLGPSFNATSCGACHNLPAVGGFGNTAVVRAGRMDANGTFTSPQGTNLIHLFSLPDHNCQPSIPADANHVIRRIPTPLYGLGLIEAIPDDAILRLQNAPGRNADGVHGRAAMVTDIASGLPRVGRFGWKAQHATILSFAGDAYLFEMGITNDLFPNEVAAGLSAQQLAACDTVPGIEDKRDPVTNTRAIDRFEAFMKFLAPASRGPMNPMVQRGQMVFNDIGCGACHVPVQMTGPNAIPALDRKPVPLFSDLLLHDIGTGDGVPQGDAQGNEFRTPPLWGLRFRKMLLHDGRALSAGEAIRMHSGEADRSRQRFRAITPEDQAALLAFLGSL